MYLVKPDPARCQHSHPCLCGTVHGKIPEHGAAHAQSLPCGHSLTPKTESGHSAGHQHWRSTYSNETEKNKDSEKHTSDLVLYLHKTLGLFYGFIKISHRN